VDRCRPVNGRVCDVGIHLQCVLEDSECVLVTLNFQVQARVLLLRSARSPLDRPSSFSLIVSASVAPVPAGMLGGRRAQAMAHVSVVG